MHTEQLKVRMEHWKEQEKKEDQEGQDKREETTKAKGIQAAEASKGSLIFRKEGTNGWHNGLVWLSRKINER